MGQKKKIGIIVAVAVIVIAVVLLLWLKYQTYHGIDVIAGFVETGSGSAEYLHYEGGTLRYSRDGIALLTEEGEELWNQPYQMSHPSLELCGETVAVGDLQGTTILVLETSGLKGEIRTTKPVESFSVSEQGIVSAILRDDEMPMVVCYDAKGNILVEQKSTFEKEGYPVDVAISRDGMGIMVSYLSVESWKMKTDVVYYYFGEEDGNQFEVGTKTLEEQIVPVTVYLNDKVSMLVGDTTLCLSKGVDNPEEIAEIPLEYQIENLAYDDKIIALLVRNDPEGYRLKVYDLSGKELASEKLEQNFSNMKVEDGEIILYDGGKCAIYEKNGHLKFDGQMDGAIKEIYPVSGFLKYIVIDDKAFQEIRLKK